MAPTRRPLEKETSPFNPPPIVHPICHLFVSGRVSTKNYICKKTHVVSTHLKTTLPPWKPSFKNTPTVSPYHLALLRRGSASSKWPACSWSKLCSCEPGIGWDFPIKFELPGINSLRLLRQLCYCIYKYLNVNFMYMYIYIIYMAVIFHRWNNMGNDCKQEIVISYQKIKSLRNPCRSKRMVPRGSLHPPLCMKRRGKVLQPSSACL